LIKQSFNLNGNIIVKEAVLKWFLIEFKAMLTPLFF
jgi:hypothetical protein